MVSERMCEGRRRPGRAWYYDGRGPEGAGGCAAAVAAAAAAAARAPGLVFGGARAADPGLAFYVESCVYLMTLYDLLSSRHKVWQVYDCFYATGEEDQETFEFMISYGVKMNFLYFMDAYWKNKK